MNPPWRSPDEPPADDCLVHLLLPAADDLTRPCEVKGAFIDGRFIYRPYGGPWIVERDVREPGEILGWQPA
jgi:hypothetical protein